MSQSIEEIIELKETNYFLRTVKEFCAFIESTDKADIEFLTELQRLLLMLYYNAITLSWTNLDHNEESADKLSNEEQNEILKRISDRIGESRFYWDVFDPTNDKDTEPVCGDLADDIGDIYKDVKKGLLNFDVGTIASKEQAVWDWKFGFEKHWGQHAIDALRTIHYLLEE